MLLPALARAKAQALSTACKNHLHEMGFAFRMYADDNKVYPYYSDYTKPNMAGKWEMTIQPYYRLDWTNQAYHCPAYVGPVTGLAGSVLNMDTDFWMGSYAYNVWGAANIGYSTLGVGVEDDPTIMQQRHDNPLPAHTEAQVVAPSELFLVMDARGEVSSALLPFYGFSFAGLDCAGCIPTVGWGNEVTGQQMPLQHGPRFNVLSCDGHVAPFEILDLFNRTNSARRWNIDNQPHRELWGL
jgi:prepilin-type processing-associated H-X9-DG protein